MTGTTTEMLALVVGSLLAVLGLVYVLYPLIRAGAHTPLPPDAPEPRPEASAIDALREIEFDAATGKLSPEDYATLKATYTPMALEELRAREAGAAATASAGDRAADEAAEALIARAKQRALFCVECGAPIGSDAARFCVECGAALAV